MPTVTKIERSANATPAKDRVVELLQQIREQQNLHTDTELAAYLGVSTVTVWRWRQGTAPSRVIARLATMVQPARRRSRRPKE